MYVPDDPREVEQKAATFFEDVFFVSDELQKASPEEVAEAGAKLGTTFPATYTEFVNRLGSGTYFDTFHVFMPDEVVANAQAFREQWQDEFDDCDLIPETGQKPSVAEAVVIAETEFGEHFFFAASDPGRIYLLDEAWIHDMGDTLTGAIERYIAQRGITNVRDFVPTGFERGEVEFAATEVPDVMRLYDALAALDLHDRVSRSDDDSLHLCLYSQQMGGELYVDGYASATLKTAVDKIRSEIVQQYLKVLGEFGYRVASDGEDEEELDEDAPQEKYPQFPSPSDWLRAAFDEHAAASLDKQRHLADLIEDNAWEFAVDEGKISFANELSYDAQVLGTQSDETDTWLWAWANVASEIPYPLLQAALQTRQLGIEHDVPELISPQFAVSEDLEGHHLAMISVGLVGANAYYRGEYDGGAVFLLIQDPDFRRETENPMVRVAVTFPMAIADLPITDHRRALTGYLRFYDLASETDGSDIVIKDAAGSELRATFDDQGRFTYMHGHLAGQ